MEQQIALRSVASAKSRSERQRYFLRKFCWFPLAFLIWAVVGGLTSLGCLALSFLLPARVGRPIGQVLIQKLFAFFVWYLDVTDLVRVEFRGIESLRGCAGKIIVANHPCLLDVVFIVSRLPRVFCLMKEGILSNLVLCGTARLAGYVDNRSSKKLIEASAARLRAGDTLLVFPEGTRTTSTSVNPFKLGFALMAKLSEVPVETVLIQSDSRFLGKHWPFFKAPSAFPIRYSLRRGRQFVLVEGQDAKHLGRLVEEYFRVCLQSDGNQP